MRAQILERHHVRYVHILSQSAGSGRYDADFAGEMESMGCTVKLVQGDVTGALDVACAVNGTVVPPKYKRQKHHLRVCADNALQQRRQEHTDTQRRPASNLPQRARHQCQDDVDEQSLTALLASLSKDVAQIGVRRDHGCARN
ncbi:hypothetical protein F5Y01DRAFT_316401 [Xylaria sp. FL0043]|nr:hypothetical protein F5Y01DRAFT_316401 [Xylaria sp. FL0043]